MKLSRIFFILTIPFMGIGAVFLFLAYFTAFDPSVSNYFTSGSVFPTLAGIAMFLAIALGIAGGILAKGKSGVLTPMEFPSRISVPAALGALGSSIWLMIAGKGLLGVLILLVSIFFALEFGTVSVQFPSVVLWSAFTAIGGIIFLVASYYFDMTVEMNAPTKILLQMALLSMMLLITAECRVLLGRFDRLLVPVLTVLCMALCIPAGVIGFYLLIAKKTLDVTYLAAAPLTMGVGITALLQLIKVLLPERREEDAE